MAKSTDKTIKITRKKIQCSQFKETKKIEIRNIKQPATDEHVFIIIIITLATLQLFIEFDSPISEERCFSQVSTLSVNCTPISQNEKN